MVQWRARAKGMCRFLCVIVLVRDFLKNNEWTRRGVQICLLYNFELKYVIRRIKLFAI
jgi:hypothetical protein